MVRLGWLFVTVTLLCVVMVFVTGCAVDSERNSKTETHGLLCIIFCVKVDMDRESATKEKGGEVAPAAQDAPDVKPRGAVPAPADSLPAATNSPD